MVTWVPWKPVIMKKTEPNCGAPQGLLPGTHAFRDQLGPLEGLHADEGGAEGRGHQHQDGGLLAVAA